MPEERVRNAIHGARERAGNINVWQSPAPTVAIKGEDGLVLRDLSWSPRLEFVSRW
jgi:hypothetical protein